MPITHDTSFLDHMPQNVAIQFLDRVAASGPKEAFRFPRGDAWESVTWAQAGDEVRRLAAGLLSLGLEPEQRVGIASSTRYEWILADLAVMCAAGATTTVYPSTGAEDTAYIVGDSDCRIVFAEDGSQLEKLKAHQDELPNLGKVISFDDSVADGDWVITMDALAELGDAYLADHPDAIEAVSKEIKPDQLSTLIYTSGTTGTPQGRAHPPPGVGLRGRGDQGAEHPRRGRPAVPVAPDGPLVRQGAALDPARLRLRDRDRRSGRQDRREPRHREADVHGRRAPHLREGARPDRHHAGVRGRRQGEDLQEGVRGRRSRSTSSRRAGKSVPLPLKLQHQLFDKLVFSKVRERFGGRVKFFISGSAALNAEIAAWFHAAGILILEGYGMTENAAGATVNHPDQYKIGTVGMPFPGTEVRIASDGEVQLKGPHLMAGYHNRDEATAEAMTDDGWLRTGDKGELDADGFLRITGRIKELFKTSGGKYIAPPAIEAKFKAICPYVSQFMVFGAERNFVVALITLDPDAHRRLGRRERHGRHVVHRPRPLRAR